MHGAIVFVDKRARGRRNYRVQKRLSKILRNTTNTSSIFVNCSMFYRLRTVLQRCDNADSKHNANLNRLKIKKEPPTLWSVFLSPFAVIFPLETWTIRSGFFFDL